MDLRTYLGAIKDCPDGWTSVVIDERTVRVPLLTALYGVAPHYEIAAFAERAHLDSLLTASKRFSAELDGSSARMHRDCAIMVDVRGEVRYGLCLPCNPSCVLHLKPYGVNQDRLEDVKRVRSLVPAIEDICTLLTKEKIQGYIPTSLGWRYRKSRPSALVRF